MTSVPFQHKINLHRQEGEIIYSKLSEESLTISQVEKLLEKGATKRKQENANSRALHLQNESYKEMIIMLGVDPNDNSTIGSIVKGLQSEL